VAEPGKGETLRRVGGELVIVFVGVLLALAADDFREARGERAEAQESLTLLLTDLAADSVDFASGANDAQRIASGAAWLAENWARTTVPSDSLGALLYTFSTRTTLELNNSVYSGLQNANRLRLVEPASLRQALLGYYQVRQVGIRDWNEDLSTIYARLMLDELPGHVINLPGAERGTMWPPAESRVEIRTSWDDIRADAELHNVVVQYGRLVEFFGGMLRRGEAEAGELMAIIREQL